MSQQENLLHCLKQGSSSKQLFLFHSLGGYANLYLELVAAFQQDIEAWGFTLPGHGYSNQPLVNDINRVTACCLPLLNQHIKSNYILFGHSMGGIVAYFLSRYILLNSQYVTKPSALILSACSPPSEFAIKHHSKLSDQELLNLMLSYDGIPKALAHEKSFLQFMLPIFRADFQVLESSAAHDIMPLDIPVYFLWGEADKIAPIGVVSKWSKYFSQDIKLISIPNGSHFFISDQAEYTANVVDSVFADITHGP